jgi:hypothetical protein
VVLAAIPLILRHRSGRNRRDRLQCRVGITGSKVVRAGKAGVARLLPDSIRRVLQNEFRGGGLTKLEVELSDDLKQEAGLLPRLLLLNSYYFSLTAYFSLK